MIKIGQKEYELPFKADETSVRDSAGWLVCKWDDEDGRGEWIAEALNAYRKPEPLPERNGMIQEVAKDNWGVNCFECGLWLNGWVTYQEASIWFSEHLEENCEKKEK